MPYIQYLLPGSIVMSIFMMVMIGGGIIFIDDKARGLHEGYLVTPITKLELIAGFNLSGTIKAVLAGMVADDDRLAHRRHSRIRSSRCACCGCSSSIVVTAFALISMMFLLMVRVTDPLVPRAMFGVLNTLLYFPSGAVYPQQGFPAWMQVIAVVDPFTYAVHAFKSLLLKNTGFGAIGFDLLYLLVFSVVDDDGGHAALQADAVSVTRDRETRERLLKAAAQLFADRGFKHVTVRDICRAARGERRGGQLPLRRQARALPRGAAGRRSTRCARPTTRRGGRAQGGPPRSGCGVFLRCSCAGCSRARSRDAARRSISAR